MDELAGAELRGQRHVSVDYGNSPTDMQVFDGLRLHAVRIADEIHLHALCGTATGKLITWGTGWREELPPHLVRCATCLEQFPL